MLGVRGYTWTIPGTEESKKFEYREKYGVKLLEGTGDVILGSEHGHLIKLATEYAKNTTNMYSVMPIKSSCALTLRSSGTAQKRVAS